MVKGHGQTACLYPIVLSSNYLMTLVFLLIWRKSGYKSRSNYIKVKLLTANRRIKCSISNNHRKWCRQTKQIKHSLAPNLLNHQFDILLYICNPFEFCRGGGDLCFSNTSCYPFFSILGCIWDINDASTFKITT